MTNLERVAYIRGLAEGLELDTDKKERIDMMKNTKGITLVTLVITIIILLILAGVAINTLTQTGLLENAKQRSVPNHRNHQKNCVACRHGSIFYIRR